MALCKASGPIATAGLNTPRMNALALRSASFRILPPVECGSPSAALHLYDTQRQYAMRWSSLIVPSVECGSSPAALHPSGSVALLRNALHLLDNMPYNTTVFVQNIAIGNANA